jgi:hypothetical protein
MTTIEKGYEIIRKDYKAMALANEIAAENIINYIENYTKQIHLDNRIQSLTKRQLKMFEFELNEIVSLLTHKEEDFLSQKI